MISIALCDDEIRYLDFYENKIKEVSSKNNLLVDIIRFKNGESLLFYLEDHSHKFDLIYLDILTGGMTGIDTALQIRKFNSYAKIIFLTSSESYVYRAFEARASNYLVKDLHDEKFESVFLSTIKTLNETDNRNVIIFKRNQTEIAFNLSDIAYFESYQRMIIVHTADKKQQEFYYKLSDLNKDLSNKDFILIHRSYFVNMQYIQKVSKQSLILKNKIELPISRNLSADVVKIYINYLNK